MLVLVFVAQWALLSVAIRKVGLEQMPVHPERDSDVLLPQPAAAADPD